MDVYIYDQGTHISCINNLFVIKRNTESTARLPLHMVESMIEKSQIKMAIDVTALIISSGIIIEKSQIILMGT